MKQHFVIEIFIFTIYYFIVAFFDNPYFVGLVFSIVVGYKWGRNEVVKNYILKTVKDDRYKATTLSISSYLSSVIQFIMSFLIGFIMNKYSYEAGFYTMGTMLFIMLSVNFLFIRKNNF